MCERFPAGDRGRPRGDEPARGHGSVRGAPCETGPAALRRERRDAGPCLRPLRRGSRRAAEAFRRLRVLRLDEWGGLAADDPASSEAQIRRADRRAARPPRRALLRVPRRRGRSVGRVRAHTPGRRGAGPHRRVRARPGCSTATSASTSRHASSSPSAHVATLSRTSREPFDARGRRAALPDTG